MFSRQSLTMPSPGQFPKSKCEQGNTPICHLTFLFINICTITHQYLKFIKTIHLHRVISSVLCK